MNWPNGPGDIGVADCPGASRSWKVWPHAVNVTAASFRPIFVTVYFVPSVVMAIVLPTGPPQANALHGPITAQDAAT